MNRGRGYRASASIQASVADTLATPSPCERRITAGVSALAHAHALVSYTTTTTTTTAMPFMQLCFCGDLTTDRENVWLSCGHRFHIDCAARWFAQCDACPKCWNADMGDIAKVAKSMQSFGVTTPEAVSRVPTVVSLCAPREVIPRCCLDREMAWTCTMARGIVEKKWQCQICMRELRKDDMRLANALRDFRELTIVCSNHTPALIFYMDPCRTNEATCSIVGGSAGKPPLVIERCWRRPLQTMYPIDVTSVSSSSCNLP